MVVTVPIFASQLCKGFSAEDIKKAYMEKYTTDMVTYCQSIDEGGLIGANVLSMKDNMQITVSGNEERILLVARYDKEKTSYFAFSTDEKEAEYVLLKREGDSDDALFETIDDDDEYDEIEDYFNDLLFGEVDYD